MDHIDHTIRQKYAIKKIVKPNWHYCDIGACRGEILEFLMNNMEEGHAFEPSVTNYLFLKNKFQDKNLTLNNMAVSDKSGVSKFILMPDAYLGCLNDNKPSHVDENQGHTVNVDTVNLDTYFKDKKIDFIKLDVEGAEWDVFKGSTNLLKERNILWQVEFHWDEDWHQRNMLYDLGYAIYDLELKKLDKDASRPYQAFVCREDYFSVK